MHSRLMILTAALILAGSVAVTFAGPTDPTDTPADEVTQEGDLETPEQLSPPDDGDDGDIDDGDVDDGEDDGDVDDGEDGDGDVGDEGGEGDGPRDLRGVPEDSPACDNHEDTDGDGDGCGIVTNAGGIDLRLPQPAVDNINRVNERHQNADDTDEAEEVSEESSGGGPGHGQGHGNSNGHGRGQD